MRKKIEKNSETKMSFSNIRHLKMPEKLWKLVTKASKSDRSINDYIISLIENDLIKRKMLKKDIILKNFLILEIKNGTRFFDDIFTKISAASFLQRDWTKFIDQTIIKEKWLEKPPKNEIITFFLIHTVMVIISLFFIKYNPFLSIISGIIIVVIGIAVSFGMKRLSYDSAILKKKWEGFGEKINSTIEKNQNG